MKIFEKMMADPQHPAWILVRQGFMGILICIVFAVGYKSGLTNVDLMPIATLLVGLAGFDVTKLIATRQKE